jgi:hypothetical protein
MNLGSFEICPEKSETRFKAHFMDLRCHLKFAYNRDPVRAVGKLVGQ